MSTDAGTPRDPIEYLLNAMENAGQQENPADHGYRDKRAAVLSAITELRRSLTAAEAERDALRDQAHEAFQLAAAEAAQVFALRARVAALEAFVRRAATYPQTRSDETSVGHIRAEARALLAPSSEETK
mgnify:CR=1 FL=1